MSTRSAVMADNPYEKKAHRQKIKGGANPKHPDIQPYKCHNRYSGLRAVVCEQVGFRYRPLDSPRDIAELRAVTDPSPRAQDTAAHAKRLWRRRSWEVLTERNVGQG